MNILVLGATGYLGSKVVHFLLEEYQDVKLICTVRKNSNNLYRLEDIKDKIKIVPTSVDAIIALMEYESIDVIINMVTNYGRSNILYDGVIETNIELPLNVLNLSANKGVKQFITIGTGLPDLFNMYSFSKSMLSEFGKFYVEKLKINFIDLKLEMFYGDDEPRDRFIPNTIERMIDGKNVMTTLGTQRRDIVSVNDVLLSIRMVLDKKPTGYLQIPIGSGCAPTIREIVEYIWEKTDRKSFVDYGSIPMRENEPDCIPDLSEIMKLGEWNPVFWKDGLDKMINHIKEEKSRENID